MVADSASSIPIREPRAPMNSELKLDAKEKDWLVLGYHPVDRRFSACKSSRKRDVSNVVMLVENKHINESWFEWKGEVAGATDGSVKMVM